jgi:hypothetical protein
MVNNKFSKKELLNEIESGLEDLTSDQIKELIKKETEKNSDDINMEYIDLCFKLLETKQNVSISTNNKKTKVKKPIKVLLIAATFIVVLVSTITVSAQLNLNIPQKIAQLINGNAEVESNLEIANTKVENYAFLDSDLAMKLAEHGISPVTFPKEMITENCSITNIKYSSDENAVSTDAVVNFEYKNTNGKMTVRQFNYDYKFSGSWSELNVISGQTIVSNGMDVLIFERVNSCSIIYRDNLTEYNIYLESNIETAIKFAESIK